MAHQPDSSVIETVVQLLCESGLSQMAEAVRIMLNEAMKIERSQVLEAGPWERSERRRGYANGFKPKTLETRLGSMTVDVPQTRGVEFYHSALARSSTSNRQGMSRRDLNHISRQAAEAPRTQEHGRSYDGNAKTVDRRPRFKPHYADGRDPHGGSNPDFSDSAQVAGSILLREFGCGHLRDSIRGHNEPA